MKETDASGYARGGSGKTYRLKAGKIRAVQHRPAPKVQEKSPPQPKRTPPLWACYVDGVRLPCRAWSRSEARAQFKERLGGPIPRGAKLVMEG